MKPVTHSLFKFIGLTAAFTLLPLFALWGWFYAADPMLLFRAPEAAVDFPDITHKGTLIVNSFNRYNPQQKYDSFLFGSSLMIAVPIEKWKEYLPEDASIYHYDASAMSVEQMVTYLDYLMERAPVRNLLIIINTAILDIPETPHPGGVLATSPFVTKSRRHYIRDNFGYWRWFMGPRYCMPYFLCRVKTKYLHENFRRYFETSDPFYDVVWPFIHMRKFDPADGTEELTINDSVHAAGFYNFQYSPADSLVQHPPKSFDPLITPTRRAHLERFADLLDSLGTDYRFVNVADFARHNDYPMLLNDADSVALREVFGEHFVSAQWPMLKLWFNPYSTYDGFHFTSPVAEEIMRYVYSEYPVRSDEL